MPLTRNVGVLSALLLVCAHGLMRGKRIDPASVKVDTIVQGIGKGDIAFTIIDGNDKGILRYNPRQKELRFAATHGELSPGTSELPAQRRMELLRPLIERFFFKFGREKTYSFGIAGYREMNARLVAAAAESSEWDPRRGRPRTGTLSVYVTRLMNERRTYQELESLFHDLGYDIRVSAVENVLVLREKDLQESDRALLGTKSVPDAKFPYSAATYFTIEGKN